MAIKTFTTGEVLTAADTNTYLANSGLVYVKSQTIGSAVASVVVTDAFSATYDSYKIIVTGGASSVTTRVRITIGSATTAYYWGLNASRFDNGGGVAVGGSNVAFWDYAGCCDSAIIDVSAEIRNPFLTKKTFLTTQFIDSSVAAFTGAGPTNGILTDTTSYTTCTITPASGTLTGGTITVYGYRKA
jgi:hypothetical protein